MKEYVYIFRDYDGMVIAVNHDFAHGLDQALKAIGDSYGFCLKTGTQRKLRYFAEASETSITYRNIDEIFDYNLTCLKWLVSD